MSFKCAPAYLEPSMLLIDLGEFLSRHRLIVLSVHCQAIIQSILISGRLGPNVQNTSCFGLRLKHLKSEEHHWLHPDLTVGEVEQRYEQLHLEAEWRWRAMHNTYTAVISQKKKKSHNIHSNNGFISTLEPLIFKDLATVFTIVTE